MGIEFLNDAADFRLENPEIYSGLYFPLACESGLKSSVTPLLGGDCKLDQESFLLEPVSVENLHNNRSSRNFWCITEKGVWSAAGVSARQEADRFTADQEESSLTAGFMWQTVSRVSKKFGLRSEITTFIPMDENAEYMAAKIINDSDIPRTVICIAAIPIYGRSADNIRDHRNVTSMLHRIRTTEYGVSVKPTMSFDEKGHRENFTTYYVLGSTGDGKAPDSLFPTVESFLGEGGTFLHPCSVFGNHPGYPPGTKIDGKEAMGALRFPAIQLAPGASAEFLLILGITDKEDDLQNKIADLTREKFRKKLAETKTYWQEKVNVQYHTGSPEFDRFLRWVSFQPFLRRIFGCSFLPHHDYGRGGRGWRDLWQDCLALLLMDPADVRSMIVSNYGGVRFDGTNATIIGTGPGSFIADRNGIARVWMDHALWPLMTTKLYIDQTGDISILDEACPYFKDPQIRRGTGIDSGWNETYGSCQKSEDGEICTGSILEHILIQHLAGFLETGKHNIYRLRGADWNDALDMAPEHGESVAFSCAYAGNLKDLASLLRDLAGQSDAPVREIAEEVLTLIRMDHKAFDDLNKKQAVLQDFLDQCEHNISGRKAVVSLEFLADELESRADWLMDHIRKQEWIHGAQPDEGWYNSYYDNHGRQTDGITDSGVRMMLTGQVFAIMSGTATDKDIQAIVKSADRYLYNKETGGYRLNTDFHELKFDMGRMFGFAYGEKENGSVFSHMAVMYANALYKRGFVREGYKALQALADTAMNFSISKIYPGIPEYFNAEGRGLYHYLTGAASWYMLTIITEAYGIHGEKGDLVICPRLVKEQFDESGNASISLFFAGKEFCISFRNPGKKNCGEYRIRTAEIEGLSELLLPNISVGDKQLVIPRDVIINSAGRSAAIIITLD